MHRREETGSPRHALGEQQMPETLGKTQAQPAKKVKPGSSSGSRVKLGTRPHKTNRHKSLAGFTHAPNSLARSQPAANRHPWRVHLRGYEICHRGALEHSGRSCRADGNGVTVRACWSANPQAGFGRCSMIHVGVTLRIQRMSTGAKHLHGDRPAYLSACKRLTRFRPSA
jgi:hypothetical protein